jgi:methionyl-tRNA formyltransferase
MKVLIVTQDDPFYMPLFFRHFFEEHSRSGKGIDIIGVVIQRPLGQKSKISLIKRMVYFYGPIAFTVQALKYLLMKIERRLNSLGVVLTGGSLGYIFMKNRVNVLKYKNVNSDTFAHFAQESKVDLIVSVAASQIFKPGILRVPKKCCINIHNAPLPYYRGMMPSFWQMYHGEKYALTTVHEMVEEVDRGRIVYQDRIPIQKGITLDRLIKATKKRSAEALIKVLKMFVENKLTYRALPVSEGTYFSFPTKRDIAEFRRRGNRII